MVQALVIHTFWVVQVFDSHCSVGLKSAPPLHVYNKYGRDRNYCTAGASDSLVWFYDTISCSANLLWWEMFTSLQVPLVAIYKLLHFGGSVLLLRIIFIFSFLPSSLRESFFRLFYLWLRLGWSVFENTRHILLSYGTVWGAKVIVITASMVSQTQVLKNEIFNAFCAWYFLVIFYDYSLPL